MDLGLGLVGIQVGTHSFQIGATSVAAAMGYPNSHIKQMLLSAVFKSYICPPPKKNKLSCLIDVSF